MRRRKFLAGTSAVIAAPHVAKADMLLLGAGSSGAVTAAPPFNPTSLFAGGQTGGWWDPADHTTTFKDAAGTIPANADGDLVVRINDKSGNGNDLVGSGVTPATLKNLGGTWYILFDGVSNYLQKVFVLNQPFTRINALQVVTWNNLNRIFDGAGGLDVTLLVETGVSPNVALNAAFASDPQTTDLTTGVNHVAKEIFNGASSKLAIDNAADVTGNPGATNAGGLTIGANSAPLNFSNIRWFGGIVIGRVLTGPEQASCRTFFGNLAGLSL